VTKMDNKPINPIKNPTILLSSIKKSITPRIRELKVSTRLLLKNRLAIVGIAIVLAIVIIAIFAPVLAPTPAKQRDPYVIPKDLTQGITPPGTNGKILGTGEDGSDIYYGIIWGSRMSIVIALFVVTISTFIGVVLGALAGYYGGKIDEVLMRVTDVFLSIPSLVLAMAVVSVMKPTIDNIMLALIITWWPSYARLIRGQVISVRENTYVEAARACGAKKSRILFRHIVPNSISPMIVAATMDIGGVVLTAAGLSYIGFGPPGITEWGRMVSDGQLLFTATIPFNGAMINPWWIVTFPAIMIFLFVMGFNLLGDGLRDVLDPRQRR
jgi:peptide/nickel transport system permease protein